MGSAAGRASSGEPAELANGDFWLGLEHRLMGQIHLMRTGIEYFADGDSFTLASGVSSRQLAPGTAATSLANADVKVLDRAAALELPRGLGVNAVNLPRRAETLAAMGRDPS